MIILVDIDFNLNVGLGSFLNYLESSISLASGGATTTHSISSPCQAPGPWAGASHPDDDREEMDKFANYQPGSLVMTAV